MNKHLPPPTIAQVTSLGNVYFKIILQRIVYDLVTSMYLSAKQLKVSCSNSNSLLVVILVFFQGIHAPWLLSKFSIFTQVNIRNPTVWLVEFDVTFLYINLQVNITIRTSLQNGH